MPRLGLHGCATVALAASAVTVGGSIARAQSIEPRAYSAAPTGVNFLIGGYADSKGGPSIDSSLPLVDPKIEYSGPITAYARSLDLWGKSAKVDVIVPYGRLSGSAMFDGQPVGREVQGFSDPLMRLSAILYGASAMTLGQFRSYRQDLVVGASLQVSAPLGGYDPGKLLNLGANRWAFKPEIGVSKALGPWTLEAQGAVTLYTDNREFYGGGVRSVAPLYSAQTHVVYSFRSGIWGSLDGTFFTGGRTTVNAVNKADLQRNWRVGATLALPVNPRNSVKLYASSGVSARTGNNYDLIGAAWQYRWGGGL
jgi:hypothetical protein